MGLTLPPAIAGDDNEVEFSSKGLTTLGKLFGGLTVLGVLAAAATFAKNRILKMGGVDNSATGLIEVN